MGCGGSRVITDFMDKNKDLNYGKPSQFEAALVLVEEFNKAKVDVLKRVEYNEAVKTLKGETGQQWLIEAEYDNKKTITNSVLLADNGSGEVKETKF